MYRILGISSQHESTYQTQVKAAFFFYFDGANVCRTEDDRKENREFWKRLLRLSGSHFSHRVSSSSSTKISPVTTNEYFMIERIRCTTWPENLLSFRLWTPFSIERILENGDDLSSIVARLVQSPLPLGLEERAVHKRRHQFFEIFGEPPSPIVIDFH